MIVYICPDCEGTLVRTYPPEGDPYVICISCKEKYLLVWIKASEVTVGNENKSNRIHKGSTSMVS